MSLLDDLGALITRQDPASSDLVARTEAEFDQFVEDLYAELEARRQAFTLAQALEIPAVGRGVALITAVGAAMLPLVYRAGVALETQPRLVRKPDPFSTRYQFLRQTLDALVASRYGEAFWRLLDHDAAGYPRAAVVLPESEVRVEWDQRRFRPLYFWRDRPMVADVDIKHIAPNRRAGELHGHGPIQDSLDYLYPIHAAEEYAGSFFGSGGMPLTVLKTAAKLDKQQAADLKAQWIAQRTAAGAGGAEPAVASGGVEVDFPAVDPQKGQMTEARGAGAAIAARILGIPGALLHVETSGATITYTNPEGALEELVKTTIAPLYLAPIEQAWSELVPAPQSVRFDLADLHRASIAARFAIYSQGIAARDEQTGEQLMTVAEARAFEGWATGIDTAHTFDPEPVPEPVTVEVPRP